MFVYEPGVFAPTYKSLQCVRQCCYDYSFTHKCDAPCDITLSVLCFTQLCIINCSPLCYKVVTHDFLHACDAYTLVYYQSVNVKSENEAVMVTYLLVELGLVCTATDESLVSGTY